MTKIKFCGLRRHEDIIAVNQLMPEYAGFVFWSGSRRFIDPGQAAVLRRALKSTIVPVGVFVNEKPEQVAALLNEDVIDMAQLHGSEDDAYIRKLRKLTGKQIIRAFRILSKADVERAVKSTADYILLDAGSGSGRTFDWKLAAASDRPYFLAGGLDPQNAPEAVRQLHPYALDVSSGIETRGRKDRRKMAEFVHSVRKEYVL